MDEKMAVEVPKASVEKNAAKDGMGSDDGAYLLGSDSAGDLEGRIRG